MNIGNIISINNRTINGEKKIEKTFRLKFCYIPHLFAFHALGNEPIMQYYVFKDRLWKGKGNEEKVAINDFEIQHISPHKDKIIFLCKLIIIFAKHSVVFSAFIKKYINFD